MIGDLRCLPSLVCLVNGYLKSPANVQSWILGLPHKSYHRQISTQLFPPINSLVNDENSLVRSETAKTIAILQQRLQNQDTKEKVQDQSHADLEKRTMKMILQLMVDPVNGVVESIIKAMIHIVVENENSFKEDFFIPQIGQEVQPFLRQGFSRISQ